MATINISLPTQLKADADAMVASGHFSSFSDVMRTALRKLIAEIQYDGLVREAKREYKQGKATVLRTPRDIHAFVKKLSRSS